MTSGRTSTGPGSRSTSSSGSTARTNLLGVSGGPGSPSTSSSGSTARTNLLRVSGLPGAGKTTLLATASAAGAVTVISRDLIRAAMFPGPAPHTPEETRLAFEAMLSAAGARLRTGASVALDGCCFARRGQRERVLELAHEAGARLVGVHLELPVAAAIRRVGMPGGPHPANDRDAALVVRVAGYLASPEPDDLVIDARRPAEEIWELVRHRLADGPPGGPGRPGPTGATIVV